MRDFSKFFVLNLVVWGFVFGVSAAYAQDDASTCKQNHPDGIEVWGCFEGQPYWSISEYGGEKPMISGGTLYVPSNRVVEEPGMGGRIVSRTITQTTTVVENSITNGIDRHIYDLDKKIRDIIYP